MNKKNRHEYFHLIRQTFQGYCNAEIKFALSISFGWTAMKNEWHACFQTKCRANLISHFSLSVAQIYQRIDDLMEVTDASVRFSTLVLAIRYIFLVHFIWCESQFISSKWGLSRLHQFRTFSNRFIDVSIVKWNRGYLSIEKNIRGFQPNFKDTHAHANTHTLLHTYYICSILFCHENIKPTCTIKSFRIAYTIK